MQGEQLATEVQVARDALDLSPTDALPCVVSPCYLLSS